MIGYEIGALFELDDVSSGPFRYVNGQNPENFENPAPVEAMMHGIPGIGPLPTSANITEPDAAQNAASDLLTGMTGGLVGGRLPGAEALPQVGKPWFNPGEPNPLGAVQQMLPGYGRDDMGAPFGDSLAALLHGYHGGLLANMPSNYGEAAGSGAADRTGTPDSALGGMPIQRSKFDYGPWLTSGDREASESGNSQGRVYVPDAAGSMEGHADAEYAYPQLSSAVKRGEEPESVLDAMGRFDHLAQLERYNASLATNNPGGRSSEIGVFEPTGIAGDNATQMDNALRERAGMFPGTPDDGIIRAFKRLYPDSPAASGAQKADDAADFKSGIFLLNHRMDQLTGAGTADTDGAESVQAGDARRVSTLKLSDGSGSDAGEALGSHPDWRSYLAMDKISDAEGITGLAGTLEMLRNAERFLPKQSVAAARSEAVAAAGLSDAPEPHPSSLFGALRARGNVNDGEPEALNMRATRESAGGQRNGPSGHKNDPIYMVAVNQATGTLMPTVATAGTSTRTPAMPGQRNLP